MQHDIIILGSGPAGLTAALYAARAGKSVLVLGGNQLGGQMSTIHSLENYPGTPGVNGLELAKTMQVQAETFGAKVIFEDAVSVTSAGNGDYIYIVKTEAAEYSAKVIIIATGAKPSKLEAKGVAEFTGRGVSYCATCDGFFHSGRDVVVIGGGNSALQDALYLADIANSVKILYRKDKFSRAEDILVKRAEDNPKIEFMFNTEIAEIAGDESGLTHVITNTGDRIDVSGVFIAIGHAANTDFLPDDIERDSAGRLVPDSLPAGMFVCGDVRAGLKMQVATAVGTGCDVGMAAIAYLNSK